MTRAQKFITVIVLIVLMVVWYQYGAKLRESAQRIREAKPA